MPSVDEGRGIPAVAAVGNLLRRWLQRADTIKPSPSIEPPLVPTDFPDLESQLSEALSSIEGVESDNGGDRKKARRFAVIETATRDLLSDMIASTTLDSPGFDKIWNLLDVISILSDGGQCDPALLFWLVEELLDSQTIAGCRKVFDFLESRRERITRKHFDQKKLVILRSCNELLRRLSRAEDTTFCGRVFIFMYQSFPLGDKSSVNLRGEYHVENVTTFDRDPPKKEDEKSEDQMDVDVQQRAQPDEANKAAAPESQAHPKSVSFDGKRPPAQPLDPGALYPVFWSLQASFSQPKRLFDPAHFRAFQSGLEATMRTFQSIKPDQGSRPVKQEKQADDTRSGAKRKREEGEEDLANGFNPKYLTSRDLFELEINDLSFRRNILVQALIIMDFLLSLSAKAKEKLHSVTTLNRSVTYSDQLLSEEHTRWAYAMKKDIADYLKQGSEGPFFFRMVETVLSRDKHWVRWKIENCPSIEKPPVAPEEFLEARAAARKATTNKRLRATPMGSLSLDFLAEGTGDDDGMEKLQAKERYQLPDLASFRRKIADDEFEIEMPTNPETKAAAVLGKASKSWQALRIASRCKLAVLDKIDHPDKIDVVFEDDAQEEEEDGDEAEPEDEQQASAAQAAADRPEDRRLVVVVSPDASAADAAALSRLLLERKPGVFGRVVSHTTRPARDGEANGRDYHFVDVQAFRMMRDGDQFVEFVEADDAGAAGYGTTRKAIEAVSASGKVPLLVLSRERAQQVKDMAFPARFVFLPPPSAEGLASRWKGEAGPGEDGEAAPKKAAEDTDTAHADSGELYDWVVVQGEPDGTCKALEDWIYGRAGPEAAAAHGGRGDEQGDASMEGEPGPAAVETQAEPVSGTQADRAPPAATEESTG